MTSRERFELMRRAIERDSRRMQEPRNHAFLRALAILGSVGWPVALATVGGALLGRLLDRRWGSGAAMTVSLLMAGAVLGTLIAYRTLKDRGAS